MFGQLRRIYLDALSVPDRTTIESHIIHPVWVHVENSIMYCYILYLHLSVRSVWRLGQLDAQIVLAGHKPPQDAMTALEADQNWLPPNMEF